MTASQYIENNYYLLKNEFYNITRGASTDLFEDFFHDCLSIFLTHKKAEEVIENGTAKFFLIRIGLNQWRSTTSAFHYQYRTHLTQELTDEIVDTDYDFEVDVLMDVLLRSLDEMYNLDERSRYKAMVIILYHSLGNNYSEVQRQFDIPRTTVKDIYVSGIKQLSEIVSTNLQKLDNGTYELSNDFASQFNDWCNNRSLTEQQAVSMASELFKTQYFKPVKV
jgi:DNA-directed RNA polymerase specialized sigma24 family protein